MGKRNYFLHIIVTAIVVIVCAFSVLLLVENRPSNKDASFASFENSLSQMQKDYDVLADIQTYTLSENEYLLDDEQLYLSAQSLFSYGLIEEVKQEYISSDELNSDNIYVEQNENNVEIKWTPSTNRLIVYTNDNIDSYGAIKSAEYNGWHIFQYQNESDAQSAYDYYLNLKGINDVSYDVVVHADGVKVQEIEEQEIYKDISSNITTSGYRSWGLDYMGFKNYSDLVLTGGKNKIAVAVLDTGINTSHELFTNGDRILHKYGKNCTDESSPSGYAYEDLNFHGSHTSGVIAQATDSNVKIIPVKVLDYNGDGYASDIIEGLEYVARIKSNVTSDGYSLKVVNMSLGLKSTAGSSVVTNLTNAVNSVYNSGIIPVVSAGNDRKNTVNVCPANVANAVTVSALKKSSTGALSFDSSYSNYGSSVDFAAPGTSIISCNANPNYGRYNGNYLSADGTSMAAPHVAAAFALAFSNPYLEDNSISAVNSLFEENAIDYGTTGKDVYYGYGLINLENVAIKTYDGEVNIIEGEESDGRKYVQLSYSGESSYKIFYSLEEDIVSIPPKESDSVSLYNGGKIYIDETTKISASAYIYSGSYYFSNLIGQVVNTNTNQTVFSKIIYIDYIDISINYIVTIDGVLTEYVGDLETVRILDKKNVKYTENGKEKIKEVVITSITSSAFNGTNVTKVILPTTLTLIGEKAFYYNTKIVEIDASNVSGNLTIGNYAFTSCSNLEKINLGNTKILGIGNYAFRYVSKLSDLNVEYVKSIGDYSFADCSGFDRLELLSIESIGKYAFSKMSISKLHLGPNITSIGTQNYLRIQEVYGYRGTVAETFAYQNNITFFDMTLRTSRDVNGNSIISVENNFTLNFNVSGQNVYVSNLTLNIDNSVKSLPISCIDLQNLGAHHYLVSVNVPNTNFASIGSYILTVNFGDEFNEKLSVTRNIKVVSNNTPTISLEYDKNSHFSVYINGEEYTSSTVLFQGEQYIFEFVAESGYGLPDTVKINGKDYTLSDGKVDYKPTTDVTISMDELVRLEKVDINFTYNSSLGSFDVVEGYGVKVNNNLAQVNIGKNLQFKVFPIDGYVVSYVTVNNKTLEAVDGVYTVQNIDSIQDIVIAFEEAVYNINSLSLGKGGTYSQQFGDNSKIRIVANEGYEIEFVMVNGKLVSLVGDTLYLEPGDSDIVISFTDATGIFGDTSGVAIKYMIVLIVIIALYITGRVILYFVLKAQDKKNPKKNSRK